MSKQITVREIHAVLHWNLRSRPDLGWRNAVADGALEPANPFERHAARPPRRWFVLFCLLAVLTVGCFVYFNSFAVTQARMDPQQLHDSLLDKAVR
jgi:hypothetical protein